MGFWDYFKKEKRDLTDAVLTTPSQSVGGTGLTFGSLLQGSNALALSTVFRCIQIISESIAVLPVYVENKDGKRVSHSLDFVFKNSDNRMTKYDMMKMLVQSAIIKGNGFLYIERNGDGSVKRLRFLESGDVNIIYNKATDELYYSAPLISKRKIEPINMIHIKLYTNDGVNGVSLLNVGSRTVKMANTTEQSALNYFDSGCNLSGVLTVASSLTPQQIKDIKRAWIESYTSGANGIAVLQGNMNFAPISQNGVQSQMLESREYMVSEICRLFGINPLLLGANNGASYGSIESAQNEFVLHTLLPYIINIEEEFTKKLLKPSESNFGVVLDENVLLRVDKASEATYYTTLTNTGILTINEVRDKLGYAPVEGGDELRIPYSDANQNKINNGNDEQGNKTDSADRDESE